MAEDFILRNVLESDLTILFDHQRDLDASRMAAFILRDPPDWDAFLGKGIATRAFSEFLRHLERRPLYASAAGDNAASIRVFQKCGFTICGHTKSYAGARGGEIEEVMQHLEA